MRHDEELYVDHETFPTSQPRGFDQEYSEPGFWSKLLGFAQKAGADIVEKALQLYYVAEDPNAPKWVKAVVFGALGYFILTLDAIPDISPMIGFADDLGVLASALATVASYLNPAIKAKARAKMRAIFKRNGDAGHVDDEVSL